MQISPSSDQRKVNPRVIPFYPILFGIYPVLALVAVNITQIDISLTYRAFAASIVLALVLFLALRLMLRNWMKAALLTFLFLFLFFSYGHVYNFLKNPANPLLGLVRYRILGLFWIGLAGLAVWFASRIAADLTPITRVLNFIAVILLVYPAFQIGQFEEKNLTLKHVAITSNSPAPFPQASQSYPDIYYIILDGYMRADNIKVVYDFDNSEFINALTQRGFYVANCSLSNYAFTEHSFASSLNINYLGVLGASNDNSANALINNNFVRRFLENRGYTTVAFETGFAWSQWEDANVYYKYVPRSFQLNSFENLLLQTTLFRIPSDIFNLKGQNNNTSSDVLGHDRTIANLNLLDQVPNKIKRPKFVFAHLIIPHPPYVFSPNGDYVADGSLVKFIYDLNTPGDDKPGYTNAIRFINSAMLKVIDNILADSKIPPVIIIQGDHGAFRFNSPDQRMSILNAYYFPSTSARTALYPTITPVNTFRILFDSYFGQNLPLLTDVSRYSLVSDRWAFENVPNQCH
jgi:hypothetical protein